MKKERKERVEIPEGGGRYEGAPIEFSITLYHPCWNSTKKGSPGKKSSKAFLNLTHHSIKCVIKKWCHIFFSFR